jgi:uncharacterized metal-binding protein
MAEGKTLIYACSGAADVGEISDLAARRLKREGASAMDCIAAIGARHGGKLKAAREADRLLAIDGCPHACASKCLRDAGFADFKSLQLADIGMNKGETPANADNIARAVEMAKEILTP